MAMAGESFCGLLGCRRFSKADLFRVATGTQLFAGAAAESPKILGNCSGYIGHFICMDVKSGVYAWPIGCGC